MNAPTRDFKADRALAAIEPTPLWRHFAELCARPRPSHHEEAVAQYCMAQAQAAGLVVVRDDVGNVIIRKPATVGMEGCKGIVMQSHLDMVPQKNNDTDHDFINDPIRAYQDGDWVRATGTTLGADNGIGVAAIMAVMTATDIAHGPLEALLTINEEAGMDGAKGLQPGWLEGELLLNLDTEEDGELYIGCAGGVDVNISLPYVAETWPADHDAVIISVKGLRGGHSGIDIHRGHGNAIKLATRAAQLACEQFGARLCQINGGSLRNAIPREGSVVMAVPTANIESLHSAIATLENTCRNELDGTEAKLTLTCESADRGPSCLPETIAAGLLRALAACPNGALRMSSTVDDVVETSTNLGVITTKPDQIRIQCLSRSLIDSARDNTAAAVAACFELAGATARIENSYPGWQPQAQSDLVDQMRKLHLDHFGTTPNLKVIHAGLECGILGAAYPHWDMVSFGPTITGAHSPDERVHLPSVAKFWDYLLLALKQVAC